MTKKRALPPDRIAECTAAHELFLAKKNQLKLSQKKVAELAGITPAAVNLYFKGINPLNAKFAAVLSRLMGEPVEKFSPRLAREIESLAGGVEPRPAGLDDAKQAAAAKVMEMLQKHGKSLTGSAQERLLQAVSESLEEARTGKVITADFSRAPKLMDGDILIPQYDLRASMGHGQVPADYVEFMRNVVVSGVQLEKLGLDFTSPANLSIITGWGESMAPTIKSKDPVIVDRGITEFMGDGVYVITWDDMLYIKRLQNAGDGKLDLISDNPKHKARVVNVDEVTIHARVLLVWNAHKL